MDGNLSSERIDTSDLWRNARSPAASPCSAVIGGEQDPSGGSKRLTADARARVGQHASLVPRLARSYGRRRARHVRDELVSAGYDALVTAAQNYDEARDGAFGVFATRKIRGHIRNELRRSAATTSDLVALGTDHEDEVGGRGAVNDKAYLEGMHSIAGSEATRRAARGPEAELNDRRENGRVLAALIKASNALDPRSRDVVRLHCEEALTWSQVAARLRISRTAAHGAFRVAIKKLERLLRAQGVRTAGGFAEA